MLGLTVAILPGEAPKRTINELSVCTQSSASVLVITTFVTETYSIKKTYQTQWYQACFQQGRQEVEVSGLPPLRFERAVGCASPPSAATLHKTKNF